MIPDISPDILLPEIAGTRSFGFGFGYTQSTRFCKPAGTGGSRPTDGGNGRQQADGRRDGRTAGTGGSRPTGASGTPGGRRLGGRDGGCRDGRPGGRQDGRQQARPRGHQTPASARRRCEKSRSREAGSAALPPVARQRQARWRPGGRVMFFGAFSIFGPPGPSWLAGWICGVVVYFG
jgi:hypothetical protein